MVLHFFSLVTTHGKEPSILYIVYHEVHLSAHSRDMYEKLKDCVS
jgi:hypothetical protein